MNVLRRRANNLSIDLVGTHKCIETYSQARRNACGRSLSTLHAQKECKKLERVWHIGYRAKNLDLAITPIVDINTKNHGHAWHRRTMIFFAQMLHYILVARKVPAI
jgi:hypothetical protein